MAVHRAHVIASQPQLWNKKRFYYDKKSLEQMIHSITDHEHEGSSPEFFYEDDDH